jgi:hypothetical protein
MRRTLATALIALAAGCGAAVAAVPLANLPTVFKKQLATLHARHVGPILLPETFLAYRQKRMYPSLFRSTGGYELRLLSRPGHCAHFDVCDVAEFSSRHGSPDGAVKIALTQGITGFYRAQRCSERTNTCLPPRIEFVYRGWTYTIGGEIASSYTAPDVFAHMADSAIGHGPR